MQMFGIFFHLVLFLIWRYAEVYLTQAQDTAMCIEKLLQLKLLEGRIEVTVTVSKLKKDDEICKSNS